MTDGESGELLVALIRDYRDSDLSGRDRAMLDYAVKLTRRPSTVTIADVETLRGEGFDDRGVHDICSITAYFAFVNRVADGLGVEIEPTTGTGSNS
jgi:uncharacterized peroxidase-related enzyme